MDTDTPSFPDDWAMGSSERCQRLVGHQQSDDSKELINDDGRYNRPYSKRQQLFFLSCLLRRNLRLEDRVTWLTFQTYRAVEAHRAVLVL